MKGPDEEISLFGHPISYVAGSALVGSQVSIFSEEYNYHVFSRISVYFLEIIFSFYKIN